MQDIGIVTKEECCSQLNLCCSSNTIISNTDFKNTLKNALKDYFANSANSKLTINEFRDLIVIYFKNMSNTIDLSGTGYYSKEKLIDIYNKARGTTSCTPNCVNKQCGNNGCGGTCGTCVGGKICSNGKCIAKCATNSQCSYLSTECKTGICNSTKTCSTINKKNGISCTSGTCQNGACINVQSTKRTSGTYTCKTCTSSHNWYIDENHVLYWDGKPYVPHAINDFPLIDKDINEIIAGIDFLFDNGITDFAIGGYEAGFIDLKDNSYDKTKRAALDAKLKKVIEHIEKRGGTFTFSYNINNIVKNSLGGYPSIDFMLDSNTQNAIRNDIREYVKVISSPALRAFEFSEELNGLDPIVDYVSRLNKDLSKVLNIYGGIVKEEVGNIPVITKFAPPDAPNNNKFESSYKHTILLSYLLGLYAENIDGIVMQYHGIMPEEVKFHVQQSSIITRVLNSAPKTKLSWGYGQVLAAGFTLYQSKTLMRDHYLEMINGGVTGFLYDQFSSFGMIEFGLEGVSKQERDTNSRWWGELKPELQTKILEYAKLNTFSSGKWAVSPTVEELKLKSPKVLTSTKVKDIAKKNPNVNRLLSLGAVLNEPVFNPNYGLWKVYISNKDGEGPWFLWMSDSADGKVVLDRIKLLADARQVGYPIPPDEQLLGSTSSESCSVGNEKGIKCTSAEQCSTKEWSNGCCIGSSATCSSSTTTSTSSGTCTTSSGEKGTTCPSKTQCSTGEWMNNCCIGTGATCSSTSTQLNTCVNDCVSKGEPLQECQSWCAKQNI